MNVSKAKALFLAAYASWSEDNVPRLAAAFAFYAVLSLAPLLVLAVALAGLFLGEASVRERVISSAAEALGKPSAEFLTTLIAKTTKPGAGTIATIVGLALAIYGASNLFGQLNESVNAIWKIKARPNGGFVVNFLRDKAFSVIMMLVFILVVIAWLALDSWLGWLARRAGGFPGWPFVSLLASAVFLTGVFSVSFKSLPKGKVAWRDAWFPAFVTAVGFALSKLFLSLYFTYAGVASAYGSAGALVVILLWIYYTSQIYFFGIELTCSNSHLYGSQAGAKLEALTRS